MTGVDDWKSALISEYCVFWDWAGACGLDGVGDGDGAGEGAGEGEGAGDGAGAGVLARGGLEGLDA